MGFIVPTTSLFDIEDRDGNKYYACQFIQINNGVLMFDTRTSLGGVRYQMDIEDIRNIIMLPPAEEVTDKSQYIELFEESNVESD